MEGPKYFESPLWLLLHDRKMIGLRDGISFCLFISERYDDAEKCALQNRRVELAEMDQDVFGADTHIYGKLIQDATLQTLDVHIMGNTLRMSLC